MNDDADATVVPVFIEIEQYSNEKWEWSSDTQTLELDRVLPEPYKYPFAYGFIPGTLGGDGDALDALIVTRSPHPIIQSMTYDVHIVGVLIMEDEQGRDEKILGVLEKDWMEGVRDVEDIPMKSRDDIQYFFAKYKTKTPNKWSRVHGLLGREAAIEIYCKSRRNLLGAPT